MEKLQQKHFRGITVKQLNLYIETINDYLNEHIPVVTNWSTTVKHLSDYLNEHDFVKHEGIAINDGTIDDFITRIQNENNNDNLNFLPDNKLNQMTTKPTVYQSSVLDNYRDKYFKGLNQQHYTQRNLGNDLDKIQAYSAIYNERGSPFPKK